MSRLSLLVLLLSLAAAPAASAQVGIGGLVGDPTGLTIKLGGGRGGVAVDVGLSDDLFVQAHYLVRETPLRGAGADVRFLFGPGGFYQKRDGDDALGVSALLGLSVYVAPEFELFGQVTPGIRLTPDVDGGAGVAAGLRFYP
ncbi:MAG TPA: hypothetical protein VGB53_08420 [Rubricoccaceae bacterium]|jgi:hypothetical protein